MSKRRFFDTPECGGYIEAAPIKAKSYTEVNYNVIREDVIEHDFYS
ncbi:MAG TPA: hypothetical protein VK253_02080 [Candidatus Binatia bacterium]|nr:hypothetical protein [Candidatus Binatia bacterium]